MNTIRIPLGHESLDVTLAHLKGKDGESEEAPEHANNSSLALYALELLKTKVSQREICRGQAGSPAFVFRAIFSRLTVIWEWLR
jgi:hypothetical protein